MTSTAGDDFYGRCRQIASGGVDQQLKTVAL
jgi:hypothetical protein